VALAGKKHYSQTDNLWARFKVPEWGVFCHTARLRNRTPRLKLILSDSTHWPLQKVFFDITPCIKGAIHT
jgi:hypothetical protein